MAAAMLLLRVNTSTSALLKGSKTCQFGIQYEPLLPDDGKTQPFLRPIDNVYGNMPAFLLLKLCIRYDPQVVPIDYRL